MVIVEWRENYIADGHTMLTLCRNQLCVLVLTEGLEVEINHCGINQIVTRGLNCSNHCCACPGRNLVS